MKLLLLKNSQIGIYLFCLLFTILLPGCSDDSSDVHSVKPTSKHNTVKHSPSKDSDIPAVMVLVKKVIQKDVPIYINSFGIFKASQNVDINAQVIGQIKKVCFTSGDRIKKGQLLFEIDPGIYKAAVLNSEAQLDISIAKMKNKELIYQHDKPLVNSHAIEVQRFELIETDLLVAKADVIMSKAQLMTAKINLQNCTIVSPINGIVGINNAGAGNVIDTTAILANIKTINPLNIDFSVPERNVSMLKEAITSGKLKLINFVAEKNIYGIEKQMQYNGFLTYLNNQANAESSTISLSASVPNPDLKLLPGMYASIKLIVGMDKNAILVPKEAVRFGENSQIVFVVSKENKVKMVNIKTGLEQGDYLVVNSGKLKQGDEVIVTGFMDISDGSKVKIISNETEKIKHKKKTGKIPEVKDNKKTKTVK